VQLLQKAKASYELPALIQNLDRYSLLVIDDISYVRRNELETSVLFELICHRYERKSLLVTSNQPFRDWDEIFPSGHFQETYQYSSARPRVRNTEVGAFYWTVQAPDIVNSGREEQGSVSL